MGTDLAHEEESTIPGKLGKALATVKDWLRTALTNVKKSLGRPAVLAAIIGVAGGMVIQWMRGGDDDARVIVVVPSIEREAEIVISRSGSITIASRSVISPSGNVEASDRATELYNEGLSFHARGEYREALGKFFAAVTRNPGFSKAYNNLGNTFMELRDPKGAVGAFQSALRFGENESAYHNNLGTAYIGLKQFVKSIEKFKDAIRLNEEYPAAHFNVAYAYAQLGNHIQAEKWYRKALELDSSLHEANIEIGFILEERDETEAAIEQYEKAIEINATSAIPYYNLGNALTRLGDQIIEGGEPNEEAVKGYRNTAIVRFKQAIERDPDSSFYHNGLGVALERLEKIELAKLSFEKSIELDLTTLRPSTTLARLSII